MIAEFALIHSAIKVSLFMANYDKKLRIGVDIRRKGKVEKTTEFTKRVKKAQKKVVVALKKT